MTIEEGLEYHWPTVANTTMAIMTKFFYSNASIVNYSKILELETEFNNQYSNDIAEDVINRSITFANDLTEQIIFWSTTDGGYAAQFNNFPKNTNHYRVLNFGNLLHLANELYNLIGEIIDHLFH